jgi:hypothetical protein
MARRSVRRSKPTKPPKPKAPILTVEQKRRRIECIRDLHAHIFPKARSGRSTFSGKRFCTLDDEIAEPNPVVAAPRKSNPTHLAHEAGRSIPAGVASISTRRGAVWHDSGEEVVIHEQSTKGLSFSYNPRSSRPGPGA